MKTKKQKTIVQEVASPIEEQREFYKQRTALIGGIFKLNDLAQINIIRRALHSCGIRL